MDESSPQRQHVPEADKVIPMPIPRRIAFDFPEEVASAWHPGDPEFAAMVNGASLTMPYLEPFLIRTVRDALPLVADEQIRDSGRAFNMQEQFHYQAHRRFNDALKAHRYPQLVSIEHRMQAAFARLSRRSLRCRMAYTAGFEAMTIGLTKWLIEQRVELFAGADTRVASFILWHMVEETEHKCVAFDVYQAAFGGSPGGYLARAFGVFHGSLDVMRFSMQGYRAILKADGRWTQLKSRIRLARRLGSFVRHVAPYLLRAALPGHNPRREQDPQWVLDWIEGYGAAGEHDVPLLDTNDRSMPVPFQRASLTAG